MQKIKWNNDYNSGFKKIDLQHKDLFKIFNTILYKFHNNKSLKKDIKKLVDYGYYHLKLEEFVFKKYNILNDNHINEHNTFVNYVINLQTLKREEINNDDIEFLRIWLYNHISVKDIILFNEIKNGNYSYYQRKMNNIDIMITYYKIYFGIV